MLTNIRNWLAVNGNYLKGMTVGQFGYSYLATGRARSEATSPAFISPFSLLVPSILPRHFYATTISYLARWLTRAPAALICCGKPMVALVALALFR